MRLTVAISLLRSKPQSDGRTDGASLRYGLISTVDLKTAKILRVPHLGLFRKNHPIQDTRG
jgi:hypothetical protein